eukprot:superscaffoldBa00000144_g2093
MGEMVVRTSSRNKDNADLLREMGGVAFVYNLSKSSIVHSDVKETALFTLGTLAEANGAGQTLAQTTDCLDILLDLFRSTFPLSTEATLKAANATQTYQLWASVCSALCGCVNNPQNGLAQYGVVSHLLSLLASPNLDPKDRPSVLLTLGHCTEASEDHQSQLVQCGGLPLIITLLTEDTSEEVRRAATFILQTCKQATMSLGVPGLIARQGEVENVKPLKNMESFRSSARELLRRIDLLEKRQAKEAEDEQEDTHPPTSTEGELFKPPVPLRRNVPQEIKGTESCVLPFEEVTSRTFATLLSSCHHSCDMHTVLQEATERFRTCHCNLLFKGENQDNTVELTHPKPKRVSAAEPQRSRENWKGLICLKRRKRKDFSCEELHYLLCGVKKYGFSWNSILWSYPFQPGRTNVDLAKKYRRLMKCKP